MSKSAQYTAKGYVIPMKWTRQQRRALAQYQRTVDHSPSTGTWNGQPVAR